MGQIIMGGDISNYKTMAITLSKAKKENRNGVIPKFAILTVKNAKSAISKPSRIVLFEEELEDTFFDVMSKYCILDDSGNKVKDARGGYPIDMRAFKASGEDYEDFKQYMAFPGGQVMDYDLGGAYYANDVDGQRVLDARGNPVVKERVSVFVQVEYFMPTENGGLVPHFFAGQGLSDRGDRMKAQFYRERVVQSVAPSENAAPAGASTNDPF